MIVNYVTLDFTYLKIMNAKHVMKIVSKIIYYFNHLIDRNYMEYYDDILIVTDLFNYSFRSKALSYGLIGNFYTLSAEMTNNNKLILSNFSKTPLSEILMSILISPLK